jgi:hypothetical protein
MQGNRESGISQNPLKNDLNSSQYYSITLPGFEFIFQIGIISQMYVINMPI